MLIFCYFSLLFFVYFLLLTHASSSYSSLGDLRLSCFTFFFFLSRSILFVCLFCFKLCSSAHLASLLFN